MTAAPLIILASARKNSNTEKFIDVVFAGTDHKLIDLLDYAVSPYNYQHKHPAEDTFISVIDEILQHKTIVFATPVYWYSMSGLLKTFLDRTTDLIKVHKDRYKQLKGRSTFLLAVGSDATLPDGFDIPFQLTSKYFGMAYQGHIYSPSSVIKTFDRTELQLFTDKIQSVK